MPAPLNPTNALDESAASSTPPAEVMALRALSSKQERDLRALRDALRYLGFSPEKLALVGDLPGGNLWVRLALQSADVRFNLERARGDLSICEPIALAAAQTWFEEVRCTPSDWSVPARDRRRA